MPVNNLTFNGLSKFGSDFGSILKRSVAIQSLPLQVLQQADAVVLSKRAAVGSLASAVAGVGASLAALGTLANNRAITATSSDSSRVSVTNSGATAPASYTINSITSLASAASETSRSGFADSSATPVSSTGKLALKVGNTTYAISLSAGQNNLVGLRDAINASGAPVSASILTTGTGASPNFLSVSAAASGATTLTLTDDPTGTQTPLLTAANQGTNAVFQVNGINVSQASNVVNSVIGGVSLSLNSISSTPVTVSLASNRSTLASALSTFANSYNALLDQVAAETGSGGGPLVGDVSVRQIQSALGQISRFSGSGFTSNLSDLGLTFGHDGHITFDSTEIGKLTDPQLSSAFTFLGSASSGFAALSNQFKQISDPVSGTLKVEQDAFTQSDLRFQDQILKVTERINTSQAALFTQLSKADASISALASQQNLLSASIQSLDYALYGRNVNTSA